jgi:2-methylcitrate dehydratase
MRAVYAASLAKRGFTGPKGLFEGPYGLEQMFAQSIPVNWEDPSLDIVKQTIMKKYCSLIHGQPVLEAVLDLKRRNRFTANDVEHVLCEVFKPAFDFAGGGSFGPKDHPEIKEQGDYNLKYLVAAALLDDQVGPAQLEELRIQAPDAQALLARVEVHPDVRFSARYPRELSAAITIRTKDGGVFVKEQHGYEGGLNRPISWERTVEKFHWLSEGFADEDLRNRIVKVVQQLDARSISDLMDLLGQVRCTSVYPRTHPGIQ